MEMGTILHSNTVVTGIILSSVMQSLVGQTQKSLLCLLLVIGYQFDDKNIYPSFTAADYIYRFPLDELTKVKKPVEENKDAGEAEDADSDDDDDDAGEEEDGDGDDGSDYEAEDSDDDAEANGDSNSDEDDDDNDEEDDDDDDDDNDEDDDDDDDDDDEPKGPPSKKKK